jgi:hypothetical protein
LLGVLGIAEVDGPALAPPGTPRGRKTQGRRQSPRRKPNAGPQVTLSPLPAQGLTLAYGPPGAGCSVTPNAEGITLRCGATTYLVLTPEGILLNGREFGVRAQTRFGASPGG